MLAAGVPYLGVCLGGQMLARVLGATVRPNPEGWHEIGYHPVAATPAGQPDFGDLDHVYQWHGEGFELPQCCDLMATGVTGHFPNQAYRYGSKVYGIQFHPECTRDIIESWMSGASEKLNERGAQQAEEQIAGACAYDAQIEAWAQRFLATWLDAEAGEAAHPAARAAAS